MFTYKIKKSDDYGNFTLDILLNGNKIFNVDGNLSDDITVHDEYFYIENNDKNVQIYVECDDVLLFDKDKRKNTVVKALYDKNNGWIDKEKIELY